MRRTLTIAVLGSLVLLVGGVAAYAAFPATNGVVSACVLKPSGAIRIIDSTTQSCKKGEVPLTWNQQGVPGQDGEDGTTITPFDLYYVSDNTPGNQDTATRATRSAFCDVGDTPFDHDYEISGLAGTPIDTLRTVSVLTGGPKYGTFLDVVTTTAIPDDAVVEATVACLDAAPLHEL